MYDYSIIIIIMKYTIIHNTDRRLYIKAPTNIREAQIRNSFYTNVLQLMCSLFWGPVHQLFSSVVVIVVH